MEKDVEEKNLEKKKKKNRTCLIFRIITLAALLATWLFYIPFLNKSAREMKSKYQYLNPALMSIEKENLLVDFQPLREKLRQKYENRDDYLVSLYFEYLPTGANISLNRSERIWPADSIEIPIIMAVMKKIESGKWKLSNELVILDEDKDSSSGTLHRNSTGTMMTIETLIKEILVNADSTAYFTLARNLEKEELENVFANFEMDSAIKIAKTTLKQKEYPDKITVENYAVFFRSFYNSSYLTPGNAQLVLDILKDSPRNYLGLGIPDDVKFARKNKVDGGVDTRADAGIVYISERPYLLAIAIQKKNETPINDGEIEEMFKIISTEIYDYVSQAK